MKYIDIISNFVLNHPVLVILCIVYWVILRLDKYTHHNGRYDIGELVNNRFIYWKDFEENWISEWDGKRAVDGYKLREQPGCYVILVFNRWVHFGIFANYRDVYVGQSIYMYSRVHDHFNGNGNGDVYADIKYGKKVYVKCIPCNKEKLNKREKQLIKRYNATSSYNTTRGGSTIRTKNNKEK